MLGESSNRGFDWPEEDVIELLAQLDFIVAMQKSSCTLDKVEREREESKVVLELSSKMDGKYTTDQIRGRLEKLYYEGDKTPHVAGNMTKLYRHGSLEMRAIDIAVQKRIKDRYDQLHMWTPRAKRSSSKRPTPSKLTVLPTPPAKRVHKRRKELVRSQRSQTISTSVTPCKPSVKRNKRSKRVSRTSPSVVITSVKRERPPSARIQVHSIPERTRVDDSVEIDDLPASSDESLTNTLLTPDVYQHDYPKIDVQKPSLSPIPTNTITLDIQEHEDLIHELSYFRQKWEEAEGYIEEVNREKREKRALTAKMDKHMYNFEDEIRRKNSRIADLEMQVRRQSLLQPCLDLKSGELDVGTLTEIRSKAKLLTKRIAAIEQVSGLRLPGKKGMIADWSPELKKLTKKALGNTTYDLQYYMNNLLASDIPAERVVQALVGAAVCEEVFHQKFKCTEMLPTPLLDEYRKNIAAAYDINVLRSLDFASHQSVIMSNHFQNNVLPRKGRNLAERFLQILAPFVEDNGIAEGTERFLWRLEGIFTTAFHLKTLLMISNDVFECIWPAPGSEFEFTTMKIAGSAGQDIDHCDQPEKSGAVILPLSPGLRLYSRDRRMIDYDGFKSAHDRADGPPTVVAESMVYT